jgi:hypothetical protein
MEQLDDCGSCYLPGAVPWRDGVRTGACSANLFDLQAQGYR